MTNLSVGRILKVKRLMMGLSQADLAKRVGLSQSALSRIEQQRSDPKLSHVVRILEELEMEPNKVLIPNSAGIKDLMH